MIKFLDFKSIVIFICKEALNIGTSGYIYVICYDKKGIGYN